MSAIRSDCAHKHNLWQVVHDLTLTHTTVASAATSRICARIIHINPRNTTAIAHNLRQQTRATAGASAIGTENRTSLVFVTLETFVQHTFRSRTVVRVGQMTQTGFRAGLSVVNAVVVPDAGAFFGQSEAHVASQSGCFVEQTNRCTLLARIRKILGCKNRETNMIKLHKIIDTAHYITIR